ncbi:uncharacterized protein ACJ7VT_020666 [Polymixia lowei]
MNSGLLLAVVVLVDCCCPGLCNCSFSVLDTAVVYSECSLTHFPLHGIPQNTTRLSFQSTNLSIIEASDLRAVPLLIYLQLYSNNLKSLPSDLLSGVPLLDNLDLTGNKLSYLPPNVFGHAPLSNLVLKNNLIEKVHAEWFPDNSSLTWLDLSGNRLISVPSALFQKLPHLEDLDLSDNNLQELQPDALNPLHQLKTLHLGGNKLSTLKPTTFTNTRLLTRLFLQENRLQELPPTLFQSLPHLELLMLNQNQLQRLPSGLLGELSNHQERSSQLSVVLSSNPWVCDVNIEYLWRWLIIYPQSVWFRQEVTCASPKALETRQVASLTEKDLGLTK